MEKYTTESVRKELFSKQDIGYKDFTSKLIPNVEKEKIIGVRAPLLRALAKEMAKSGDFDDFTHNLPHFYLEENSLHGMLIEKIKDPKLCLDAIDNFLPYVDNWSTCDLMNPPAFKKAPEMLVCKINSWICSPHPYTVRFAVKMLMTHFLGDRFKAEYAQTVAKVESDDYYVKMGCAWYFATALAHNYDDILPLLKNGLPDKWIHNKTIQKAEESYRITPLQKEELSALKIR